VDGLERAAHMGWFSRIVLAVSIILLVAIAAGAAEYVVIPLLSIRDDPGTVLSTTPSPDRKLRAVVTAYQDSNDVFVYLEGQGARPEQMLAIAPALLRPTVVWVDSRTVDISGRRMDVFRDERLDLRE
jgi:hypothetical protein